MWVKAWLSVIRLPYFTKSYDVGHKPSLSESVAVCVAVQLGTLKTRVRQMLQARRNAMSTTSADTPGHPCTSNAQTSASAKPAPMSSS